MSKTFKKVNTNLSFNLPPSLRNCVFKWWQIRSFPLLQSCGSKLCPRPQLEYKLRQSHFAGCKLLSLVSFGPVTDAGLHWAQTRNFQAARTRTSKLKIFFSEPAFFRWNCPVVGDANPSSGECFQLTLTRVRPFQPWIIYAHDAQIPPVVISGALPQSDRRREHASGYYCKFMSRVMSEIGFTKRSRLETPSPLLKSDYIKHPKTALQDGPKSKT